MVRLGQPGWQRREVQCRLFVAAAAVIIGWQLFVPPIVGLADQGDFVRILGPLGYAPVPPGPEHKYWYLTRTFIQDVAYRQARWEIPTSEFIFARAALFINRLIHGRQQFFDLTLVGFVHAAAFLLALGRLFYVTRFLKLYGFVWLLILVIVTDVGYVSYFNSLYTEPASLIFFLSWLAEALALSRAKQLPIAALVRCTVFAVLLITAKVQNAPLCAPLAIYGVSVAQRITHPRRQLLVGCVAATLVGAGCFIYQALPATLRVTTSYNAVFSGILPYSQDRSVDLKKLGLNPDYALYSGTLAWSKGTGVADGRLVLAIENEIGPVRLLTFYLEHPDHIRRRFLALLRPGLSLRPEFCGNFDRTAGRPPGARSSALALWSTFHQDLGPVGAACILFAIMLFVFCGIVLFARSRGLCSMQKRWLELATCVCTLCLISFVPPAFLDASDDVKHLFLFNVLIDTCFVVGVAALLERLVSRSASTTSETSS